MLPPRTRWTSCDSACATPKPCPLLEVTDTGSPHPDALAPDADLRTDLPRYRVFRDGELHRRADRHLARTGATISSAFLLGLLVHLRMGAGRRRPAARAPEPGHQRPDVRHRTRCVGAGPFAGPLVVSMRPFAPTDIPRVAEITARFPAMHGAPVHIGDPAALGIADLDAPDFGDPVRIDAGRGSRLLGMRSDAAGRRTSARPSLAIFHSPGHMFITDRPHVDFDCSGGQP